LIHHQIRLTHIFLFLTQIVSSMIIATEHKMNNRLLRALGRHRDHQEGDSHHDEEQKRGSLPLRSSATRGQESASAQAQAHAADADMLSPEMLELQAARLLQQAAASRSFLSLQAQAQAQAQAQQAQAQAAARSSLGSPAYLSSVGGSFASPGGAVLDYAAALQQGVAHQQQHKMMHSLGLGYLVGHGHGNGHHQASGRGGYPQGHGGRDPNGFSSNMTMGDSLRQRLALSETLRRSQELTSMLAMERLVNQHQQQQHQEQVERLAPAASGAGAVGSSAFEQAVLASVRLQQHATQHKMQSLVVAASNNAPNVAVAGLIASRMQQENAMLDAAAVASPGRRTHYQEDQLPEVVTRRSVLQAAHEKDEELSQAVAVAKTARTSGAAAGDDAGSSSYSSDGNGSSPAKKMKEGTKRETGAPPAPVPRRPLTAYNIFFRFERAKKLGLPLDFKIGGIRQDKKRPHRKTHGKIPFVELARHVSQSWKSLPKDEKAYFENLAKEELKTYKVAKEEYEAKYGKIEAAASSTTAGSGKTSGGGSATKKTKSNPAA
jgi:hypothetical protein